MIHRPTGSARGLHSEGPPLRLTTLRRTAWARELRRTMEPKLTLWAAAWGDPKQRVQLSSAQAPAP